MQSNRSKAHFPRPAARLMHGPGGDNAWAALIQYDKPRRLEAVCVSAHDHYTRAEAYACAREEIARRELKGK